MLAFWPFLGSVHVCLWTPPKRGNKNSSWQPGKEACPPRTVQANYHPCQQQRPSPLQRAGCAVTAAHFPLVVLTLSPLSGSPLPSPHSLFSCLPPPRQIYFAVHQISTRKLQGAAERGDQTFPLFAYHPGLPSRTLLVSVPRRQRPSHLPACPSIWLPDVLRQPRPRGPMPEEAALGVSTSTGCEWTPTKARSQESWTKCL
jgi:hypothetical protein